MTDTGETKDLQSPPPSGAPVAGRAGSFVSADVATVDADGRELPVDLAAWIDEHDPVLPDPCDDQLDADPGDVAGASEVATVATKAARALAEQRSEHEPEAREATDAIGALVNNTGDDGGAASG